MPFRSTNFIMLHGLVFIVLRINNFIATAANVSGRREMGVGLNCSKETLFLVKLRKREFDNYWLELTYCICISWFFLKEVFFFLQNIWIIRTYVFSYQNLIDRIWFQTYNLGNWTTQNMQCGIRFCYQKMCQLPVIFERKFNSKK